YYTVIAALLTPLALLGEARRRALAGGRCRPSARGCAASENERPNTVPRRSGYAGLGRYCPTRETAARPPRASGKRETRHPREGAHAPASRSTPRAGEPA